MNDLPTVSIVIPNHNYGTWIGDALRSVDTQDYPNKKIIVVDDGSTDNSWDVIALNCNLKVPKINPNVLDASQIALVNKQNVAYTGRCGNTPVVAYRFDKAGGPSRARNLGIKLGWQFTHIYGFLDADDIYLSGKISKSVAKILEDPIHIGGVYTDYETFNPKTGRVIREYKEPFSRERLLRECMISCVSLVSKNALEKAGLFDETLRVAEDYDLWLRVTEHFLMLHIPECLVRLRVGGHSSTSTVQRQDWECCWKRVMEKTQERMMKAVQR